MGWNGGQSSQYCFACGAPISSSLGNSRKTCIECGKKGCEICLTHVFRDGKLIEGLYKHINDCQVEGLGDEYFYEVIDEFFDPKLIVDSARKLIIVLRARHPEYFTRSDDNTRGYFDIGFSKVFNEVVAQYFNPSGSKGGCRRFVLNEQLPSLIAHNLIELAQKRIDN